MSLPLRRLMVLFVLQQLCLWPSSPAYAHRPIFSQETGTDPQTAIPFGEPDVSQVVYRELTPTQQQVWLTVTVPKEFKLFVQIGVPVIDRFRNFRPSVAVVGPGLPAVELPFTIPEGMGAVVFSTKEVENPRVFHEHFTGTDSWILRSETVRLSEPARYYLVVFCPDGKHGKFWIAIGTREAFTLRDLLEFPSWRKKIREFHEVSKR